MRLAWTSDIHLDHASSGTRQSFLEWVKERADALIISGDIGQHNDICTMLNNIDVQFGKPTYFVLGNHDCYRGSIVATRRIVSRSAYGSRNLVYLSNMPNIGLTDTTAIVGHDGWGDSRIGDFEGSDVILNDFSLIKELDCWNRDRLDKPRLCKELKRLGDEAAEHLNLVLPVAASRFQNVFVVTHVPPFKEAAWYEGRTSDDNFLPYFCCKAVGDAVREVAKSYPKCQITVLCGHTHSGGEATISDNLKVLTASAKYGQPQIQQVFNI